MSLMDRLMDYMRALCDGDICVAFSGGVDSSVILKAACEAAKEAGRQVYAVTFDTKLHPQADLPNARRIAEDSGAIHHVIHVNELDNPAILHNPVDRCYLCKHYLFEQLLKFAHEKNIENVIEGNNADDMLVYRPGVRAVKELGVKSPLAELGITKAQVRELAAQMGLSCASRPSSPCLATRLPYGTEISFELLERLDEGETWMKDHGFAVVRLRAHGDILRIEIERSMFGLFMELEDEIVTKMKSLGFSYVTLDMEGFRSGSMDVHIKEK